MTWQKYLNDFYKKYQYNFLVQKFSDHPYPWINYHTIEYRDFIKEEEFVNHREVFYDEVIYDIDMDKELNPMQARIEAGEIAKIISSRLQDDHISHEIWSSGGTGVHIQMTFEELFKLNSMDNKIMKKLILLEYGQGYIKPRQGSGKVQIQANTLIQLEHAPHRKGGKKELIKRIPFLTDNKLDKKFYTLLEAEKVRNDLLTRYYQTKEDKEIPKAITFLENEQFVNYKDGRARALFVLTAFYKKSLKEEQLFTKINNWNKQRLGGYFSERQIRSTIKSTKPCLPVSYIIDLFDELGIPEQYLGDIKKS